MTDATAARPAGAKAAHPLDGVEKGSVGPNEVRVYNVKTKKLKVVGLRTAAELGSGWKQIQLHGDKPETVLKRIAKLKK